MKHIFLFLVTAGVLLAGCKKENDRVFEETPEERVTATLEAFQKQLQEANFGWKAIIATDSGKGDMYSFYFRFNNQNRVEMFSDFDETTSGVPKESSYRLKALQQVSLLFDTYSYIHLLADPDPASAGGEVGAGYGVDFEFFFDKERSTRDSIRLVGRKKGNLGWLVRASQEEMNGYYGSRFRDAALFNKLATFPHYFKRITVNGVVYNVQPNGRELTITWVEGGVVRSFTTRFYYDLNGAWLETPFTNGGTTITGFDNVSWQEATRTLSLHPVGSSSVVTVVGTGTPFIPDPLAWQKFRNMAYDIDSYWRSFAGFTVDGVADAYNIFDLTSTGYPFAYLIYSPEFDTGLDLLAPAFFDGSSITLHYAYASPSPPTIFSDGRVRFQGLYVLDPPATPLPTSGPFAATAATFYNSGGFYLVRTGENTYDMVSAADGRAWISWRL